MRFGHNCEERNVVVNEGDWFEAHDIIIYWYDKKLHCYNVGNNRKIPPVSAVLKWGVGRCWGFWHCSWFICFWANALDMCEYMRVSKKLAVQSALYFFIHTAFLVLLGVSYTSLYTHNAIRCLGSWLYHIFLNLCLLCGDAETVFSRFSRILCYLNKSNVAITTALLQHLTWNGQNSTE